MRRLVLLCCVLIALACKIGALATDSAILHVLASPTPITQGDVKADPVVGRRNALIPVTFTGTFPLETWLVAGTGISVSEVNQPNANALQAALTIGNDAPLGPQLLTLTNSSGQQLTARFVVLPDGVPTITSVTPSRLTRGTATTVTITGSNFASSLSHVFFSNEGDIDTKAPVVIDSETIAVEVTVLHTAALGVRQVTVVNGTDESSAAHVTIQDPPQPRFVLTSVSPAAVEAGRTTLLTLTGSNFRPNASVVVDPIAGIQARVTEVNGTTSALVSVNVASTATPGTRNIQLGVTIDDVSNAMPIQITVPTEAAIDFHANPVIISRGRSSTLTWNATSRPTAIALQCTLLIGTAKVADVPCASGERVVSPTTTTEYKLAVTGAGISDWAYATVVVEEPGPAAPSSNSQTFSTTGTHSFTVPAGITQVTLEVDGASGGAGAGSTPSNTGAAGGLGGRVTATVAVTPGETLTVVVGVGGSTAVNAGAYGFGGNGTGVGANGGSTGLGGGGGGGGSSVSRGSTVLALAGGGGGGGGNFGAVAGGAGGAGGGAGAAGNGQAAASSAAAGSGATQAAVGTGGAGAGHPGGNGSTGSARDGGEGGPGANASSGAGGGGGGGSFGGGGGGGGSQFSGTAQSGGGGGGGSSTTIGSATNVTHQQGVRSGNGLVVIRW